MEYLPVMEVLQRQSDLNKPLYNLCLRKETTVVRFKTGAKVTTLAVAHDDVEDAMAVLKGLFVRDDVRMMEAREKGSLWDMRKKIHTAST